MLRPGRGFWVATLAALGAAGILTTAGTAAPSATLVVQVVPGAISAGEPALAVATFRNLSRVTLPQARVTLHFPKGLSVVSAPNCGKITPTTQNVVCSLGDVPSGAFAHAYVSARLSGQLTQNESIRVTFALRVGPGTPQPILSGASAKVLASTDSANRGSCRKIPATLTAIFAQQVTSLPSPPPTASDSLKLPCTPLAVGVNPAPAGDFNTKLANVDVPQLSKPAIVKLFFPNETLPDEQLISNLPPGARPSFDNPHPLWRLDDKTGARYVVPKCLPGNEFPKGWHSCIISVLADPNDPGHDYDSGTITLKVQGMGFGDPRYIG
jgi:hypothetical protein